MRMTTRTDLAMRILMFCALNPGRIVRKQEVAQACGASENHLAQVIHLMARKGYLTTLRGRNGGMTLAHPAQDIRVGSVVRTFESVLPFTECSDHDAHACPLAFACRLQCVLADALEAFYATLDKTTVADLVAGNATLAGLLRLDEDPTAARV